MNYVTINGQSIATEKPRLAGPIEAKSVWDKLEKAPATFRATMTSEERAHMNNLIALARKRQGDRLFSKGRI
jgi:hypothetical protein